jgi:hypothetical protein
LFHVVLMTSEFADIAGIVYGIYWTRIRCELSWTTDDHPGNSKCPAQSSISIPNRPETSPNPSFSNASSSVESHTNFWNDSPDLNISRTREQHSLKQSSQVTSTLSGI